MVVGRRERKVWYGQRKKREEKVVWLKEEESRKGEEQVYFIPTACGVKKRVCQLCRLVMARRLCQQELYRVNAYFRCVNPGKPHTYVVLFRSQRPSCE